MKNIGLIVNTEKDINFVYTKKLIKSFNKKNIKLFISEKVYSKIKNFVKKYNFILVIKPQEFKSKTEIIFILGGDGTFLGVVRNLFNSKTYFLPINIGNLGFIAESTPSNIIKNIDNILNKNFEVEKRTALKLKIKSLGKIKVAINDILISQQSLNRMIKYEVYINNRYFAKINADGLILSTPTGSTAHSLSAGGPIVSPTTNSIILNPLCAHSLSVRPLVLNDNDIIKIKLLPLKDRKINLTIDGQIIYNLSNNDEIYIEKSRQKYKLIKLSEKTYYEILKEKFKGYN